MPGAVSLENIFYAILTFLGGIIIVFIGTAIFFPLVAFTSGIIYAILLFFYIVFVAICLLFLPIAALTFKG